MNERGPKGDHGQKGDAGNEGLRGYVGAPGLPGATGYRGETGPTGAPGLLSKAQALALAVFFVVTFTLLLILTEINISRTQHNTERLDQLCNAQPQHCK